MAGKKSRTSRVSMGGRQKANLHHEEKRQAKFAAKREAGTAYRYTKNPYDKENDYERWHEEDCIRREKNKSSKLPLAKWTSVMAKLDNALNKERLAAKEKELKGKKKGN